VRESKASYDCRKYGECDALRALKRKKAMAKKKSHKKKKGAKRVCYTVHVTKKGKFTKKKTGRTRRVCRKK
jgi:hypothetical protein